jgi:hypothetical protein
MNHSQAAKARKEPPKLKIMHCSRDGQKILIIRVEARSSRKKVPAAA